MKIKLNAAARLRSVEAALPKNWRKMPLGKDMAPKKAKLKTNFRVDKYREIIPAGTEVNYTIRHSDLIDRNVVFIFGPAVEKAGFTKEGVSLGSDPEKYLDIEV
jgi:hypothetical protein